MYQICRTDYPRATSSNGEGFANWQASLPALAGWVGVADLIHQRIKFATPQPGGAAAARRMRRRGMHGLDEPTAIRFSEMVAVASAAPTRGEGYWQSLIRREGENP